MEKKIKKFSLLDEDQPSPYSSDRTTSYADQGTEETADLKTILTERLSYNHVDNMISEDGRLWDAIIEAMEICASYKQSAEWIRVEDRLLEKERRVWMYSANSVIECYYTEKITGSPLFVAENATPLTAITGTHWIYAFKPQPPTK